MKTEIRVITDYQEFCGLKDEWNRLLDANFSSGVWQRHEWYDCWWRAFGGGAQMFIVTMRDGIELSAVMPFMIVPMRIKGLKQRVLRFIENGITPRSSFLMPEVSAERLALVWSEIFRCSSQWDLAILANIEQGNLGYDEWRGYLKENAVRQVELPERTSPYLTLSDGWEAIWNGFGRNLRRNLNRARARLAKDGSYELVECVSPQEVLGALGYCYEISKLSWKGQRGIDMAGNDRRTRFYDLITEAATANGWINIWLLKFRDRTIAFEYAFEKNGHVLPVAADYDPEFKQYSPGTVLRSLVLERLCSRNMTTYDFGGTVYDYKLFWTKRLRPHSQFWVFHSGLKSRLFYLIKAKLLPALERRKKPTPATEQMEANGEE